MTETLGWFLTWTTYGTWLPGDKRGWTEYHQGWQMPDPIRQFEAALWMSEDACRLTPLQRSEVEQQIAETCAYRGWHLHAVNCRSNHVHLVVTAPEINPIKIRNDLKAWATRRLKSKFDSERDQWWTERGSARRLHSDASLEGAILYTLDGQDRKPV